MVASRVSSKLLLVVHVVCCAFHQVLGGCINKKVCVSDQIRVTEVSGLIASLYLSRRFTVFVASVFVASEVGFENWYWWINQGTSLAASWGTVTDVR